MLSVTVRGFQSVLWRLRAAWALGQARQTSLRSIRASRPKDVLVVCYGNIYRSPFVEAWLSAQPDSDLRVRSAGFHAIAGRPSPARHVVMSRALGIDLSRHRSTIVSRSDIASADLIILMDRQNWVALRKMGAPTEKLVWLGAWAPNGGVEIPDPYRMDDRSAADLLVRITACTVSLYRDLGGALPSPLR